MARLVNSWSCRRLRKRLSWNSLLLRTYSIKSFDELIEVSDGASEDVKFVRVERDFASLGEEESVVREMTKAFRGKKYNFDHWDKAIHGFRETEKGQWSEESLPLIERLQECARTAVSNKSLELLDRIHVLDLAEDGEIKPHIDSVKFCGEVIAGVSLVSSSVMKLQHEADPDKWINLLLPRRSLYCLTGSARHNYTHAIPKGLDSSFKGHEVVRQRRISLICRTVPNNNS